MIRANGISGRDFYALNEFNRQIILKESFLTPGWDDLKPNDIATAFHIG